MLRELQLDLARAFREPAPTGEASRRVLPGLLPLGRASASRSLDVYRSALRHAVEEALREIFPVCAELVGDDCFREISRRHFARHASRRADLARVGDDLPQLVASLGFLDGVPYLADVARLELALHHAADAPDPPSLAGDGAAERLAEALAGAPDRWRFLLPPSAKLIASEHPVRAIWEAHRAPRGDESCFRIEAADLPERSMVWRASDGLRVEAVQPGLWPLLRGIERGAAAAALLSLGHDDLVHSLQDDSCDHAARLADLERLFERGWIVGAEEVPD